jgi:shikimate dehydrogenase
MAKKITGIIGYPLSHTLSPVMHNNSFKKFRMDWEYRIFETKPEEVKEFVKTSIAKDLRGYNVTIPHKQAVMLYLNSIDKAAKTIGAVNTVVNTKGNLRGYNTDYLGFIKSLKMKKINLKGKTVVMLGAGGAAHAVGYAINTFKPEEFFIYNIDEAMTGRLVKQLRLKNVTTENIEKSQDKDAVIGRADFIVNCTSVGMHDNNVVYKIDSLKKGAVVFDLIYNPPKTVFLKNAEKKGAKIINGLDMLIYQGIESFYLWTKKRPSYALVKRAVDDYWKTHK